MAERLRRGLAAGLVLGAALLGAEGAAAQEWRTIESARQVWSREPHEVQLRYGAGELRVEPATAPMLYRMELRYDESSVSPLTEYDAERRMLRLGVEGNRGRHRNRTGKAGSHATIALSREVPMRLDLEFGAGEAELELGGIALERLSISTGASETRVRFDAPNPIEAERVQIEAGAADLQVIGLGNARAARVDFQGGVGSTVLDFGGEWSRSVEASVQIGIGSVVLRLPREVGVRINKSSFLTSFDSEGLVKRGNSFYSPNWEGTAHRLTIDIDAALGSIRVEWID